MTTFSFSLYVPPKSHSRHQIRKRVPKRGFRWVARVSPEPSACALMSVPWRLPQERDTRVVVCDSSSQEGSSESEGRGVREGQPVDGGGRLAVVWDIVRRISEGERGGRVDACPAFWVYIDGGKIKMVGCGGVGGIPHGTLHAAVGTA